MPGRVAWHRFHCRQEHGASIVQTGKRYCESARCSRPCNVQAADFLADSVALNSLSNTVAEQLLQEEPTSEAPDRGPAHKRRRFDGATGSGDKAAGDGEFSSAAKVCTDGSLCQFNRHCRECTFVQTHVKASLASLMKSISCFSLCLAMKLPRTLLWPSVPEVLHVCARLNMHQTYPFQSLLLLYMHILASMHGVMHPNTDRDVLVNVVPPETFFKASCEPG